MFKNTEFEMMVYVGTVPATSDKVWNDRSVIAWPSAADAEVELGTLLEGCVVQQANVHVLATVTGATQLDVGDSVDADGYVAEAALNADSAGAGAYLAGAGKRLVAEQKPLLTIAGTASAGLIAVVLKGYRV